MAFLITAILCLLDLSSVAALSLPKPREVADLGAVLTLTGQKASDGDMFRMLHTGTLTDGISRHPGGMLWEDNPRFPSDSRLQYADDGSGLVVVSDTRHSELESRATCTTRPLDLVGDRLLVAPGQKFAFCYIEKVACTQFNLLLNSMNNITSGNAWFQSSASTLGYDPAEITRENGWFKGIFLREPTDRLLSAHRSKCERSEDGKLEDYGSCCLGNIVDETTSLKARLENFNGSLSMLKDYDGDNPHYVPMSSFCGGLAGLQDYDYVGHLEGGYTDVQKQVREMLEKVGMEFSAQAESYFPADAPETNDHVTDTSSVFNDYFSDPEDVLLVEKHYAEDYKLPGVTT